jgi:hypothetical protein
MLVWLMIAIVLGLLGIFEYLMGFSIPFPLARTVMVFLLILGMSYRIYAMERGGEKEELKNKLREMEDKVRELQMGAS